MRAVLNQHHFTPPPYNTAHDDDGAAPWGALAAAAATRDASLGLGAARLGGGGSREAGRHGSGASAGVGNGSRGGGGGGGQGGGDSSGGNRSIGRSPNRGSGRSVEEFEAVLTSAERLHFAAVYLPVVEALTTGGIFADANGMPPIPQAEAAALGNGSSSLRPTQQSPKPLLPRPWPPEPPLTVTVCERHSHVGCRPAPLGKILASDKVCEEGAGRGVFESSWLLPLDCLARSWVLTNRVRVVVSLQIVPALLLPLLYLCACVFLRVCARLRLKHCIPVATFKPNHFVCAAFFPPHCKSFHKPLPAWAQLRCLAHPAAPAAGPAGPARRASLPPQAAAASVVVVSNGSCARWVARGGCVASGRRLPKGSFSLDCRQKLEDNSAVSVNEGV